MVMFQQLVAISIQKLVAIGAQRVSRGAAVVCKKHET